MQLFNIFISDENLPCAISSSVSENSEIELSVIWIKTEIPEEKIKQCISEEIMGAFGLSEGIQTASMYDDSFGREETGYDISPFDQLKLRLLYSDRLRLRMTEAETKEETSAIIEESCTAN